ncbi:MAG: dihydropteroate synthase [Pseudohongiellaceae bacterium]
MSGKNKPGLFRFADKQLDLQRPRVMGVLNMTPDSFSDGGELLQGKSVLLDKALARAQAMVMEGASIIDVGGESTRPGAAQVSSQEEIDRVLPVVEAIHRELDTIISVDTSNPELVSLCTASGVGLINDVRALQREGALEALAQSSLPVCLMHMQGQPDTMQKAPAYNDIMQELTDFLSARVQDCENAGINRDRIILDPGFGFGKTLQHNLVILSRLDELLALKLPLLIGLSRKTMIGTLTGKDPKERMAGSLAAAVAGVMKGASIVRTHDVAVTVDALNVCAALSQSLMQDAASRAGN